MPVGRRRDRLVRRRAAGARRPPRRRAAAVAERSLLATLEAGCIAPVGALGRGRRRRADAARRGDRRRRQRRRSRGERVGPGRRRAGDRAGPRRWNCCLAARRTCWGGAMTGDSAAACRASHRLAAVGLAGAGPAAGRPGRRPGRRAAARWRAGRCRCQLISIAPPADPGALDLRAGRPRAPADYSWVGFTSVNAVDAVRRAGRRAGAATRSSRPTPGSPPSARPPPRRCGPPGCRSISCRRTGGSAAALAAVWPTAAGRRVGAAAPVRHRRRRPAGRVGGQGVSGGRGDRLPHRRRRRCRPWLAAELAGGLIDAVLLTSPSTVQRAGRHARSTPAHRAGRDRPTHRRRDGRSRAGGRLHRRPTDRRGPCRRPARRRRRPITDQLRSERQHDVPDPFPARFPPSGPAGCAAPRRSGGSSRETRLHPADLVLPMFVKESLTEPAPLTSMPGVLQHTRDSLESGRGRGGRRPGSAA